MPLAVLVLALVAYGYALISYPELRRPGLIGGALGALAAVYVRRRHAGEGRPVARGDARQPTAGE